MSTPYYSVENKPDSGGRDSRSRHANGTQEGKGSDGGNDLSKIDSHRSKEKSITHSPFAWIGMCCSPVPDRKEKE
jgi:hypothetical protein